MGILRKARRIGIGLIVSLVAISATTSTVFGQSATRDLSGFSGAGSTFSVSLAVSVPGGTNVVGVEDAPPTGWVASTISNGGSWDANSQKVKWVLLQEPFPTALTYDIAPPVDAVGNLCFDGTISFDGPSVTIDGDACLAVGIPAVSSIGVAVLATILLLAGCVMVARRSKSESVAIE